MKCKYCNASIPDTVPPQKRCPSCGASIMEKPKQKIPGLIWFIAGIFLFTGVLILFSAICDGFIYYTNREHYAQVDAAIVEIHKEVTYDRINETDDVDYTVYVTYTWDGTVYEHMELSYHDQDMREGDIIRIEIDTRNPREIVSNGVWLVLLGIPVTALGVAILHFFRKQFRAGSAR